MGSKTDDWRKIAEGELKGRPLEDLTWKTLEGIDVKPLYTEEDVEGMEHRAPFPGRRRSRAV